MNQKTKIIKTAKICKNISKAFYILNCIACTVFIALAIILPSTNAIKSISKTECAIIFGVLALYAFFLIGLLWNVESAFRETEKNQNGIFVELTPNLVGMTEYTEGLQYGQDVDVYIRKIDYDKKKVKLAVINNYL